MSLLFLPLLFIPANSIDEEALNGLVADTLTIKVGYFGGPYYEKAVFPLEELWAMDVVYADYTFIDNMPDVVIDHVAGVRLSDLMEAAGIDLGSVETFYFRTRDKQSDYYTSYTKEALIDTTRYCYYSLPDNWDEEEGEGNELSTSYGEPVDTLIALADDWNRCIAGATFGSDYSNLDTSTRFRLIFGQTNGRERTASRSARWIHEIVVELGGAPTLTLTADVLEGEVGSVLRTEAGVTAESAVLANESIKFTSSDESIATVDENGGITLQGEGTAIITAEFAGVTAELEVTGIPGAESTEISPGGGESETPQDIQTIQPAEPEIPQESEPETEDPEEPEPESPEDTESEDPEDPEDPEESEPEDPEPSEQPEPQGENTAESHYKPIIALQPEVLTATDVGGVQNRRTEEMEAQSELGNIEKDVPITPVLLAFGLLLLLGIVGFTVKFYKDTREKKHD